MVIQLQLVNGYFFPVDAISRETLVSEMSFERFPSHRFDTVSAILVARGHKLAFYDYIPTTFQTNNIVRGAKIGGVATPTKNPCIGCRLRFNCDADDCGRKCFKLFTNK